MCDATRKEDRVSSHHIDIGMLRIIEFSADANIIDRQRRSNSDELFSRSHRDVDVDHLLNMSDFESRSSISTPRSSCTDMASPQLVMPRGYEYNENSPLGLGTYRVRTFTG